MVIRRRVIHHSKGIRLRATRHRDILHSKGILPSRAILLPTRNSLNSNREKTMLDSWRDGM